MRSFRNANQLYNYRFKTSNIVNILANSIFNYY